MAYDNKFSVHEGYVLHSDKPIGHLQNAIWQFPSRTWPMHKATATLRWAPKKIVHKKITMGRVWPWPLAFVKHYIFKRGFLDGWPGFVIAVGNFEGTFYRYVKALELQKGTQWQAPTAPPDDVWTSNLPAPTRSAWECTAGAPDPGRGVREPPPMAWISPQGLEDRCGYGPLVHAGPCAGRTA